MEKRVLPGSFWTATDFGFFVVEKIERIGSELWVYYHKKADPTQKYCCLIRAFLNRFTLYENS